jgi:hypothetical protein
MVHNIQSHQLTPLFCCCLCGDSCASTVPIGIPMWQVPLLDMRRFHLLLAGASWMGEYGDPDSDDWDFLQQYSPYHNIDPETSYPPIL